MGDLERQGVILPDGTIVLEEKLDRVISGALKSCIHEHGNISLKMIPSATKRILGALKTHNKTRRENAS